MHNQSFQLYSLLKDISECCQDRESIQARSFGCTPAEARCLITIQYQKCRNTAELADEMGIAKSRVTRILDGLVAKDLAIRSEDVKDRRICLVHLTKKGLDTANNLTSSILSLHSELLNSLPKQIRSDTAKVLAALKEAMKSMKLRLENGEFASEKLSLSQMN